MKIICIICTEGGPYARLPTGAMLSKTKYIVEFNLAMRFLSLK